MPADDSLRFAFGRDRVGSIVWTRLTSVSDDSAYATVESNDCTVAAPVHVSSIELAHNLALVLTEENLTFKNEPVYANTGAVTTGHGKAHTAGLELFEFGMQSAAIVAPVAVAEPVETGDGPGNSAGHGNSQHASNSAAAKASAANELTEPGVTLVHGHSHPSHSASASAIGAAEPVETGDAPGNSAGHGNSQQASQSAIAESAGLDLTTGKSGGSGEWQQASHSAAPNVSAAAQPVEFVSWIGGAGHEPAFHFKNQSAPSTPIEQRNDWPVLLGHAGDVAAIPQVGPAAMEEHAASHVNNGEHHAIGHLPHELLI
jgi:hypothetical protein